MQRKWITRLACAALVAAVALTFAPVAYAQRGARNSASLYRGFQPGFYGVGPGYNYPGSGVSFGFGFGNNPGMYSNYGYPRYNTYAPRAYNYSTPNYYNAPGYGYYSAPGSYYAPSTMGVPGNQPYQYPMTGTAATESQSMYRPPAGTALITIRLPADAALWVDDLPTTQTGAVRQFVTPGTLEPGKPYHYKLKAQWMENGQPVVRERTANFTAGGEVTVDFTQPTEQ